MKKQTSFGVIPLRQVDKTWQVLLVRHQSGYWGAPKGHKEVGESSKMAAIRELREETGLEVVFFFSAPPLQECYQFMHEGTKVSKVVTYFLAYVTGNVQIQEEELIDAKWLSFTDAHAQMTYSEGKRLMGQVSQWFEGKEEPRQSTRVE